MIVYGTKGVNLKNGEVRDVQCPGCETQTSMKYSIFKRYAHIYFIPFLPASTVTIVECNHCKRTYDAKVLLLDFQKKLRRDTEKNPVKTPVWMYSGTALLLLGVGAAVYFNAQTKEEEKNYALKPKAGDVYYYKMDTVPHFYTSIRVDKVTKDSLAATANDFITDMPSGMDKIDDPKNYTNQKFLISKERIIELQQSDTIFTIKRE